MGLDCAESRLALDCSYAATCPIVQEKVITNTERAMVSAIPKVKWSYYTFSASEDCVWSARQQGKKNCDRYALDDLWMIARVVLKGSWP